MPPKERVVLKRRSTSDSAALKKRKLARRLNANLNNTGTGLDFQFGFQSEPQPPSLSQSLEVFKERGALETCNSIEKEIEQEIEKEVVNQPSEKMIAEDESESRQLDISSDSTAGIRSDLHKQQKLNAQDKSIFTDTNLQNIGSIVTSNIELLNQNESDKGTEIESDIDVGVNTVPHSQIEQSYQLHQLHQSSNHSQSPNSKNSLPSSGQISNLFSKRSISGLTELLRDVDNSLPKEFVEYRRISSNKIRTSDTLINNLTKENKKLKDRIKELKKENILSGRQSKDLVKKNEQKLAKVNQSLDNYRNVETDLMSEINDLKLKLETTTNEKKESEENDKTKNEVLELLSGLSCIAFIEDETKICFTVQQISGVGTLIYKIVIGKEVAGELAYIPLWDEPDSFQGNWQENVQVIKKHLPDYLVGELTFPSNSLHAFYLKLTKSLNKKK